MELYNVVDKERRYNKTVVIMKHNESIENHSHPGNTEEITVVAGFLRVRYKDTSYPLEEGYTLEILPKEDHSLTAVGGTSVFVCKIC